MLKKILIVSIVLLNAFLQCDIEIRRDQPRINIRIFKADDSLENLNDFPVSNDVKIDFKEIIEYFADQKKFNDANITIPKIIFLNGNPKNGDKWTLARVIAKEMNFSIIRIFPFELFESNIQLQYILKQLEEAGPCIVFIDNFDELIKKSVFNSKFVFQLKSSVEILQQLPVVLICAVNNVEKLKINEIVSEAGLVKEILIPYPDLQSREQILNTYIKNLKINTNADIKKIAMTTYGFAVSNLFELVNETKALMIKSAKENARLEDFDLAFEKLAFGKNRQYKIRDEGRKITAYHEAGHALVKILLLRDINPLHKVTIVSRNAFLGVNCYYSEERVQYSQDEIYKLIQIALGGTIAEKIIFNNIFTGAESDLRKATDLAMSMICNFGMAENLVPMIYNPNDKMIKKEVQSLIKKAYENTYRLLNENKEKLIKLANILLEKETVYGSDIGDILEISKKEK